MDTQFKNYFMIMSKIGFTVRPIFSPVFSDFPFIEYCLSLAFSKFLTLRLFTFELLTEMSATWLLSLL